MAEVQDGAHEADEHDDATRAYSAFVEAASAHLADVVPTAALEANRVILSLNRASQAVTYDLESVLLRPQGWSWATYRMLFVLWNAGDVQPSELARLTGSTRASVSNLVRPLVADGLVRRTGAAHDRRAVTLALTDKGRKEIQRLFAAVNQRETEWADILTPLERQTFIALAGKLLAGPSSFEPKRRYDRSAGNGAAPRSAAGEGR